MSLRRSDRFKGWPIVVSLLPGYVLSNVLFPTAGNGLARIALLVVLAAPMAAAIELLLGRRRRKGRLASFEAPTCQAAIEAADSTPSQRTPR